MKTPRSSSTKHRNQTKKKLIKKSDVNLKTVRITTIDQKRRRRIQIRIQIRVKANPIMKAEIGHTIKDLALDLTKEKKASEGGNERKAGKMKTAHLVKR